MSKSNAMENALLELIFKGTTFANVAINATSSPITDLYVSLHTADPGEAGDQTTNECTYGSYARVAVARSGSGWTVSGNSVSPAANVDFPQASSGSETATHWAVGKSSSGSGVLFYSGALNANFAISTGVTPHLTTASTITED